MTIYRLSWKQYQCGGDWIIEGHYATEDLAYAYRDQFEDKGYSTRIEAVKVWTE